MQHQLKVISNFQQKYGYLNFLLKINCILQMKLGVVEFDVTFANVVKATVAKKRQILDTRQVYNTTEIDNIVRKKLSFGKNSSDLINLKKIIS